MKTAPALALLLIATTATALATPHDSLPIQDNSFLIEEAYNQETNVVQHIFTFQRMNDRSWLATFTQEWPVGGITHQLSYTIPLQRPSPPGTSGLGDALVNYRYQLLGDGKSDLAIAPRASIILPTGNRRRSLGNGGFGLDLNLPASIVISDRVVTHLNAGMTKIPSTDAPTTKSAGASVIWAALPKVHLMLESRWSRDVTSTTVVSPGLRWAWDLPRDLQIVPGIAMPIDTRTHEKSVFLYLSLEHPFR